MLELIGWFTNAGFTEVEFESGKFTVITGRAIRGAQGLIHNKLHENPGFITLIKESGGGALLVFELKNSGNQIQLECYTPLLIFSFFGKELQFTPNPRWFCKYLKKGYQILSEFKLFAMAL